jgi:hypothetical protein
VTQEERDMLLLETARHLRMLLDSMSDGRSGWYQYGQVRRAYQSASLDLISRLDVLLAKGGA